MVILLSGLCSSGNISCNYIFILVQMYLLVTQFKNSEGGWENGHWCGGHFCCFYSLILALTREIAQGEREDDYGSERALFTLIPSEDQDPSLSLLSLLSLSLFSLLSLSLSPLSLSLSLSSLSLSLAYSLLSLSLMRDKSITDWLYELDYSFKMLTSAFCFTQRESARTQE